MTDWNIDKVILKPGSALREIQSLQAAMSTSEPIGVRCTGCGSSLDDARLAEEKAKRLGLISCCPERKMIPIYSAPPAPSVAVKDLEWKACNEGFGHGLMHYGTGAFGHWYGVSRVKPGYWGCVHHIDGKAIHLPMAESLEAAKVAAQADYEARILSALSAQEHETDPTLWVSPIDLRAWQKSKAGEIWAWSENLEGQCVPLYAAHPALSVAVKDLEWVEGPEGSYMEVSESILGTYRVWEINGMACVSLEGGPGRIFGATIPDAKAAAQTDYETRIRSALVES